MLMLLRQLFSIVALPFTMTVLIPLWIMRGERATFAMPRDGRAGALVAIGIVLFAVGASLFASSLYLFWTRGRGTLAPWDPPKYFVADGPYRYVRNPMISGVICIIFAEGCVLRNLALAEWAGLFFLLNAIYIPLSEEPMLQARFGESYREYTRHVRRFIPRLHAWTSTDRNHS